MIYLRVCSCLLVPTGFFLIFGISSIINLILNFGVQLKENSFLADLWLQNPEPLYLKFYAFNWTNSEDLYTPGVKPKFEEIGPFTFIETKIKHNPVWHDNGTVTFQQYHSYVYNRELSAVDSNTTITTLNPVLATLGHIVNIQRWTYWKRIGLKMALSQFNQKMSVTVPFSDYALLGYPDVLVSLSSSLPISVLPNLPFDDKFAWFLGRNASFEPEGIFNMGTSANNLGVLEEWNHSKNSKFYEETCGSFEGVSAGELFPLYQHENTVSIFLPDMCRAVTLDFEREEEVDGVKGRKYLASARFLDNGTLFTENKCNCPGECLPSGALNISSCKYSGPVYVSLPHFNRGDQYYLSGVDGMKPDALKHDFYYTLEPTTGVPLKVAQRIQLNLYLSPVNDIKMFENIPKVMFPVLWFEENFKLPDHVNTSLKIFLYLPLILRTLGVIILCTGLWLNRNLLKLLLRKPKKDNHGYLETHQLKESDVKQKNSKEEESV